MVTGYGKVDGRLVAVAAYDFTVMAGSMGMTGELKVTRLRELALTKRIPFVWLLDSAGARIQEAVGSLFAGSGHLFREEVINSGCTAGRCADGAVRGRDRIYPGLGRLRADGQGPRLDGARRTAPGARGDRRTAGGLYRLGVSGLGRSRLLVEGAEAFDVTLTLPDDADVVEALMTPPQHVAPVRLAAGQSVSVVVDHYPDTSRFAAIGTSVQVILGPPHGTDAEEIAVAADLAAASDVAVVVVGTTARWRARVSIVRRWPCPGARTNWSRRVVAANPRTIVVVNSGAPVLLPWAEDAAAVLLNLVRRPGVRPRAGRRAARRGRARRAAADDLAGVRSGPAVHPARQRRLHAPRGPVHRLPGLRRDGRFRLFPFGHGIGYTTWSYDSLVVGHDRAGVAACVQVRNTGARPGREVIQVYPSGSRI